MTSLLPTCSVPASNDDLPSEVRCPQRLYSLMGAERCLSWQSETGCGNACSAKASPAVVQLARSGPLPSPRWRGEGYLGKSNAEVLVLTRLRKLLDEGLDADVIRERLGLGFGELRGFIDRLTGASTVRTKRRGWRHPVQLGLAVILRGMGARTRQAPEAQPIRHRRKAWPRPMQLTLALFLGEQAAQQQSRHA